MSARPQDLLEPIEYPESDGEPMAETEIHAELMINLRFALKRHFRDEPNVHVGVNLLMYWVEGDKRKRKAPDLFVVFGVPKEPARRTWKVWEEGKAPDVVIELSSRQTWLEDLYEKWQVYARLGVREYFIFDPEYDYLPEPLMAWRLAKRQYRHLPINNDCVLSAVLGLELVNIGATLCLRDPQTGELLPTEEEEIARAEREAARAEQEAARAKQEAARAERAEAELARLRAELARRKRKPAKKRGK